MTQKEDGEFLVSSLIKSRCFRNVVFRGLSGVLSPLSPFLKRRTELLPSGIAEPIFLRYLPNKTGETAINYNKTENLF
jgi:hypothetical protein